MSKEKNTKCIIIGKFERLHDEEYIARSFESLGVNVIRVTTTEQPRTVIQLIEKEQPDFVLYTKLSYGMHNPYFFGKLKETGVKTICWVFDLYWDYARQHQVKTNPIFKADIVITTDGGHEEKWLEEGINHKVVRQGIYEPECVLLPFEKPLYDIIFVGSDNGCFPQRREYMQSLDPFYNFKWFGKRDSAEVRGMELNKLYAKAKIVVGDSYYSPFYWSNRVVETLGRGGFLIHQEVPGLKEEYPYLITYAKDNFRDLRIKIDYYLAHEDERREIIKKNFEWVKSRYLMKHKCEELLKLI